MAEAQKRLKVLLLAPYYNKAVAGESWSTYQWVKGISEHCETTVLTMHPKGWREEESPTAAREVINWPDFPVPKKLQRLAWEMKPAYIRFYRRARRWIRQRVKDGWHFDLIHQINPLALRYPCPAAGMGLKFIIGPLAGSLQTPEGFRDQTTDKQWYRKLRSLDQWRLKHDPMMVRTYSEAELVIGVAPYVEKLLAHLHPKRFEAMSETGIEKIARRPAMENLDNRPLRLLFVGRIIRTKGVIDAIRAVSQVCREISVQFDIVGVGDALEQCRGEAKNLEVEDCVHFHGRIPREEVDQWYERADIFLFPSFREPSGNVVMEALGYGLPIITCNEGGPGYVVDETCGVCVPVVNPEQYANALAEAIRELAQDTAALKRLSEGALKRVEKLAVWEHKISRLLEYYRAVSA